MNRKQIFSQLQMKRDRQQLTQSQQYLAGLNLFHSMGLSPSSAEKGLANIFMYDQDQSPNSQMLMAQYRGARDHRRENKFLSISEKFSPSESPGKALKRSSAKDYSIIFNEKGVNDSDKNENGFLSTLRMRSSQNKHLNKTQAQFSQQHPQSQCLSLNQLQQIKLLKQQQLKQEYLYLLKQQQGLQEQLKSGENTVPKESLREKGRRKPSPQQEENFRARELEEQELQVSSYLCIKNPVIQHSLKAQTDRNLESNSNRKEGKQQNYVPLFVRQSLKKRSQNKQIIQSSQNRAQLSSILGISPDLKITYSPSRSSDRRNNQSKEPRGRPKKLHSLQNSFNQEHTDRAPSEPKPASQTLNLKNSISKLGEFRQIFRDFSGNPKSYLNELVDSNLFDDITYCAKTKTGTVKGNPEKKNQDSYLIIDRLRGQGALCFAVFDGHGPFGHVVSQFCKFYFPKLFEHYQEKILQNPQRVLQSIFEILTQILLEESEINLSLSGCTALVLFLFRSKVYCLNLGDSRAILLKRQSQNKQILQTLQITRDHRPSDENESKRILLSGGRLEPLRNSRGYPVGPSRIWAQNSNIPGLSITRSLGDSIAQSIGVISKPDVFLYDLTNLDKMIILGTDGLYEFMSNKNITDICQPFYERNDAHGAADQLTKEASLQWQTKSSIIDDITVIVIFLK